MLQGFGSLAGEHWLGNNAIHHLTTSKDYSLLIRLRDADGNEAHALYEHFHISDEEKNYRYQHALLYSHPLHREVDMTGHTD